MRPTRRRIAWRAALAAAALVPAAGHAQGVQSARPPAAHGAPGDTVTLVAGAEYQVSGPLGWLDRWLFGERWRRLWTDSIRATVLDPRAFGGLTPRSADTLYGASQLLLADGARAAYTFRLTNPQLAPILPPDLRTDAVLGPLQDLVSAIHPGASFVAAPLARAAGVREQPSRMTVLPDDSALGAYRSAFGGQLGYLRLDPWATSDARVVGSDTLFALMARRDALPVDARAFLAARLFDVYVGQTHFIPSAQRWTVAGTPAMWTPVPMGHDLAFSRFDGLVARLARVAVPMFTEFDAKYPGDLGETEYQLNLDRRLLGALSWAAWDSAARAMQLALTDSVIEGAVQALPEPWRTQSAPMLERALKARRDRLPAAARSFYALLAQEPDVFVPDGADTVTAVRDSTGEFELTVPPSFRRRFHASETKEVRLYLGRGHAVVLVRGGAYGGPPLRVITGADSCTIIDSATAAVSDLYVSDSLGTATVLDAQAGAPARVSARAVALPVYAPAAGASLVKPAQEARYGPIVWFDMFSNLGLLLGAGVERIGYAGNIAPYSSRQWIRAGYATGPENWAVQYHGDFRFGRGDTRLYVDAERSGIALLTFYGLGNETPDTGSRSFYASHQVVYRFAPSMVWHLQRGDSAAAGLLFKSVTTDTTIANFINSDRPFGWPQFGEAGVQAAYAHDSRDSPVAARRGMLFWAVGKYFPTLLDVHEPFVSINGAVSTYLTPDDDRRFTIALRAGGQKVWGPFPVFEAAFLGGESTVGGLPPQRYAGEASLFGNFEARWELTHVPFVLRWDFGVSGIVDAGRVWAAGDSSRVWHAGIGGGIWTLLPQRTAGAYLTAMYSEHNLAFYLGTRFRY
ncbi:MAG TPA: hypothetical protein VMT93_05675 [Gemmatimonadaceae bacterium]|nr:hypothetical protein [Gemmatimonadaceae bacterium]